MGCKGVPVDDLAEQADGLAAGQVRKIHRCLGVPSPLQDAALQSHTPPTSREP